ncbi:MAG: ribonuclease Z [Flavobacteriales bacterium]
MKFSVTILGSGAALPIIGRMPTSQVVNLSEQLFMIDCAEGTQLQIRRYKIRLQRINHIFISHMHGDHYLGLQGVISSMSLLGRKTALTIYGPEGLEELIRLNLKVSVTYLNFDLKFVVTNPKEPEVLLTNNIVQVSTIPLRHRIACTGFKFQELPKPPKIKSEKIQELGIGIEEILALKRGEDVHRESGEILKADECTTPSPKPKSYAFCSDTAYHQSVIDLVKGVNTLYHESTFLEKDAARAKQTGHSTAHQAALVAKEAGVNHLILGHFSARYKSVEMFRSEAQETFPNVGIANDGDVFKVI